MEITRISQLTILKNESHDPVETEGDPAVGRSAVLERLEKESEPLAGLLVREREQLEDPRLQSGIVDSHAPAAHLGAVQHDVVRPGPDPTRIGVQQRDVLVHGGRERVVQARKALLVLVVLE